MEQQHRRKIQIELVGLREIADELSVTRAFLHREIARGRLQAIRLGGRVLVRKSEVLRYVSAGEQAAASAVE